MDELYVTNKGEEEHRDSFLGQEYVFPVGKSTKVPYAFATECLGYGSENKEPFLHRLGWTKTTNDLPEALSRLATLEVSAEPQQQDRYLASAVGVVPLPPRAAGRKAGTRAA